MKKKHIVLLLGSLLVSTALSAQTANVSIYGRLNMDINMLSDTDNSDLSTNKINSHGSRLGFKGNEALGGGLNAIFQIESNILGDTGGTTLASREVFLGLQGDWGAVKVGRMYLPYDSLYPIFADNTFRNGVITSATLWANGAANNVKAGDFDNFMDNSIRYESPSFSGLSGMLQYVTAEDTDHSYSAGGGLFYKNAGWAAGVVYQNHQGYRAVDRNDQAISAAVSYNFGFAKIAGVYEYLEYDMGGGHDKLTRNFFGAGVTVPVGSGTLFGFYGYADDGKGTAGDRVGDVIAGNNTGAQQFTLSYNYPLSKRTSLYAGYMFLDNDDAARYSYFRGASRNNGQSLTAAGTNQQAVTLGAVHFF